MTQKREIWRKRCLFAGWLILIPYTCVLLLLWFAQEGAPEGILMFVVFAFLSSPVGLVGIVLLVIGWDLGRPLFSEALPGVADRTVTQKASRPLRQNLIMVLRAAFIALLGAAIMVILANSFPIWFPYLLGDRESPEGVPGATRQPPPTWEEDNALNRSVLIEGGTFVMGSPGGHATAAADEMPEHRVTVSSFYLQEHEVTNEEYQRFDPTYTCVEGHEKHPAVALDWSEAMAYAEWLGGSLPTEAQWEYAARGAEGREYPWGIQKPTCDYANYGDCGVWGPVPVKSYEKGKTTEGVYDLTGNVREWCADWYGVYSEDAEPPVQDPQGPETGDLRVLRGGSFVDHLGFLRAAGRSSFHPVVRRGDIGFRVAWAGRGEMNN